ncbi:myb-like protein X [Watersipora subatra]|uniref:myb-like protein X n=1 Tax=Watersipora subatra TaxID=2589382 RepID=UPI00355AD848
MNGHTQRPHRFSKSPPFLLPGLFVVIVILSFNYWKTSRLNRELIASVSMTQENSQTLEKKYKDSIQEKEEKIKALQTENSRLSDDKDEWESFRSDLQKKLDDFRDELTKSQNDLKDAQSSKDQLTLSLKEAGEKLQTSTNENNDLQQYLSQLKKEKADIMSYVAVELGKDGIDYLLSQHVSLPENFTHPSADQQANCYIRAEQECRSRMQNPVQVINPNQNIPIQSPNVGIQSSEAGRSDAVNSGVQAQPKDSANPVGVENSAGDVAANVDSVDVNAGVAVNGEVNNAGVAVNGEMNNAGVEVNGEMNNANNINSNSAPESINKEVTNQVMDDTALGTGEVDESLSRAQNAGDAGEEPHTDGIAESDKLEKNVGENGGENAAGNVGENAAGNVEENAAGNVEENAAGNVEEKREIDIESEKNKIATSEDLEEGVDIRGVVEDGTYEGDDDDDDYENNPKELKVLENNEENLDVDENTTPAILLSSEKTTAASNV